MPSKMNESAPKLSISLLPHQEELQHFGDLAGIHMDSKVFRILVEFLNMGIDPIVIYNTLKAIRRSRSSRSSRLSLQLPIPSNKRCLSTNSE